MKQNVLKTSWNRLAEKIKKACENQDMDSLINITKMNFILI